ncbi:CvpA family protein [Pyxidicoccus parkwayensis]|uniref:CvpA family protein n=1 Tax=Pyxidicoccus parkwayensis TaxID=2813578 RepID=A0ABX7PB61_9BACT|nr:CvpA family protein [Pyxidicoccus parkwaysis]QSQ27715.1 CvpA family protein [Pyxidicoccus parkwaysis]
MVIDLIILGLVLFFALIGAITGASRQVANLVGLSAAYFASSRLGPVIGPRLAASLGSPIFLGIIAGSILVFIVVWLAVRYALGAVLVRFLSTGRHNEDRGLDRFLGFAFGGAKMLVIAWVALSAITFFEQHVVVAGRRFGLSTKDSLSLQAARRFNLFEMTQFSQVGNLVRLAKASGNPEAASRLQEDPAYKALRKDARFQRLLQDDALKQALSKGDTAALLRNDLVLQLIQDPDAAARLQAAVRAAERGD